MRISDWSSDGALPISGNRSLLVAGLEPGRFIELPGGGGVVYVGSMSNDGTRLSRVFVYRQDGDRLDVTTARHGELNVDGDERYLTLSQGFEVEGPLGNGRDYRLMRYASNDLRLPDVEIGRAHVRTPATNTHPVCLLLVVQKQQQQ